MGPGGQALAAEVGALVVTTPSPTGTVSGSILTVTATVSGSILTATATVTGTVQATQTPTPTTTIAPPVTATPTTTATVTTTQVITVTDFFIDVSATVNQETASLGRAIQLQNLPLVSGEPLPEGTIFFSGPVAGTTFDAALDLAVTSLSPLTVSLGRFQIVLATGQSANIDNVGTVVATVPGTTAIDLSASQNVSGIGDVTFRFTGEIATQTQ